MGIFKQKRSFEQKLSEFDEQFIQLFLSSRSFLNKVDFVRAVHLRCPFSVEFIKPDEVLVFFIIRDTSYRLRLSVKEFEDLMSYALMHIDDVL